MHVISYRQLREFSERHADCRTALENWFKVARKANYSNKYSELLSQYQPKLIRTEIENERALAIAEELMHRPSRSLEEVELYDLLIVLIEKFEQDFYKPGSDSTSHSMLQFLMEQQGLTPTDLASILGSATIVDEILAGDRELSISQIKQLSILFKVDPSVFI
jgi:HTH-type transcriptional regulator/antitoxin HigA